MLFMGLALAAIGCDEGGGNSTGSGPGSGGGVTPGQSPDGTSMIIFATFEADLPENTGYSYDANYGLESAAFTYNDGTGMQEPQAMTTFIAAAADDPDRGAYVGCTSGSGFMTWGAGLGLNLRVPAEATSPLPAELQCVPATAGAPCTFDASQDFKGVGFWARLGENVSHGVRAKVVDAQVAEPANGGNCMDGTACNNAFGAPLTGLSAAWQFYSFTWEQLAQEDYMSTKFAGLDPSHLLGFQFQVPASVSFDFCVDDVAFLAK
ncbi:MAG TPA: hypothetical protein VGP93_06110 [Polyangiaceae bacterium]|jgi:hypothetical protein|nr:hypothetical protein [Polyangiaceae bacterium]